MLRTSTISRALLLSTALFATPVCAKPQARIDTRPAAAIRARMVAPAHEPHLSHEQIVALLRQHVKYVFVLYQENRSFDSYFGTFPGANGLYSNGTAPRAAADTPGFIQPLKDVDGSTVTIQPFRIGPKELAADTDDVSHAHGEIVQKMHVVGGAPRMDRFAMAEEARYLKPGVSPLVAKQMGELTMAYEDCDTIPFLWTYANRFTLMDNMFQEVTGPSTPGNLDIIAAQTGETQWVKHPDQHIIGNGDSGPGVPVLNDSDPFWGSPYDQHKKVPVNPHDFASKHPYGVQYNQTYASLPLTLARGKLTEVTGKDERPEDDLDDVREDIGAISKGGEAAVPWRWYEEGYDQEPASGADPVDAEGMHASYITHHNGPQYFGYVSNNPEMRQNLRGLGDFFADVAQGKLPGTGGVFYVKGGYRNIAGLAPADPKVAKTFMGDDDHPGYSDAMISEALVARAVNAIASSPYWKDSAIIVTWDDSEGDYDHVAPMQRLHENGATDDVDAKPISDGPRVPLILISPFARAHAIDHEHGSHASVVKFVDEVMGLIPLAQLPDELAARKLGEETLHQANLGPEDALTPEIGDLIDGFDPARLTGKVPPLPASYAMIPQTVVDMQPSELTGNYGCRQLGIVPTNVQLNFVNPIPADFNPRPKSEPSSG